MSTDHRSNIHENVSPLGSVAKRSSTRPDHQELSNLGIEHARNNDIRHDKISLQAGRAILINPLPNRIACNGALDRSPPSLVNDLSQPGMLGIIGPHLAGIAVAQLVNHREGNHDLWAFL